MSRKIVIASDSFKGSATSKEIGKYISQGITAIRPDYQTKIFSIADGGEGTLEAIMDVLDGEYVSVTVLNPMNEQIEAKYALIDNGQTAIIEMAEASGLTLVDSTKLDIMKATTYGTGQLMRDAIERGVSKIYIGIGGSATNDGGLGMAQALGFEFYDHNNHLLSGGAQSLEKVHSIEKSKALQKLESIECIIISDVTNPLCGKNGASVVYGPQKGATMNQIEKLDRGMKHYASKLNEYFKKEIIHVEGAGAAGGLGAGLMVFANAKIKRGIDTILELIGIEAEIATADLVITGEGSLDGQSINGKAPVGIAQIAKKYKVPVVAIVGSQGENIEKIYELGINGVFDIINRPMSLEEAMQQTPQLAKSTAQNIVALVSALKS